MATAKRYGLQVVGVSFHVGSGCRDASRYELALNDAKEIFEMAEEEFGYKMTLLDIGGGFPGETHSTWNPAGLAEENDEEDEEEGEEDDNVGLEIKEPEEEEERFMFFTEIAERVRPMLDRLFPPESGVRLIAEPGRYFVAAMATIVTSVISCRENQVESGVFRPNAVDDIQAAEDLDLDVVRSRSCSFKEGDDPVMEHILEEMTEYSILFAKQNLAQQEADVYNDPLDLYKEGFETAVDLLGPPDEEQKETTHHTVEGMNKNLFSTENNSEILSFAAAGEAAINGVVLQAIADTSPLQDDYAYYINDGVYGAFNNLMFDHATVRARHFKFNPDDTVAVEENGYSKLVSSNIKQPEKDGPLKLYSSTVFGPTCDSIDVIARSILLPKLKVGDWLYFQNMGAYTSAAASTFNGFVPTDKYYVCSIMPKYFEKLAAGPHTPSILVEEEKKEDDHRC